MLNYKKFKPNKKHESKSTYSENIYTFDIETTSYFIINGKIHPSSEYLMFDEKERQNSARATMYVWQLGINDVVYYGRTWNELKEFLNKIEKYDSYIKFFWVHNLPFEFQFLKSVFSFKSIFARSPRKPITAIMTDYNIEFKCTLQLSNVKLEKLPDIYGLPVRKLKGDLDYNLLRHSKTKLTRKELSYCENDCLVLYHYIKKELETYKELSKIPMTNTGKVRRELKQIVSKNVGYLRRVRNIISDNPKVYQFAINTFQGGYTHANYIYTDYKIKNVDSFDFTSSYPYVLVTHKFPMTEFKKCELKDIKKMNPKFAYMIHIRFKNIKSNYYNNILSYSKCQHVVNARLDNGRIIKADSLETYVTDIDLRLLLKAYSIESYEIIESYYSKYDYLPKELINFILDKYINKTKFKGLEDKKIEYQLEKGKFNSIYGMCVTSVINDLVEYDDNLDWTLKKLSNKEILEKLKYEKEHGFLVFEWGVFCTSWARANLLYSLFQLDEYVIYSDTDSLKLAQGYDKKIIDYYNEYVKAKIEKVSSELNIPINRFAPVDIKGKTHMLGLFEYENDSDYKYSYKEFKTAGAKKYAYISSDYDKESNKYTDNIHITIAGVPKSGAKCLKSLDDFKDDLIFEYKYTNKHLLVYIEEQPEEVMTDYLGVTYKVSDKTAVSLLPAEYKLGKSADYMNLLTDNHTRRAEFNFKEGES